MKKMALFLLLACFGVAQAETVFQCNTRNGKKIALHKNGNFVTYSFGRNLAAPEMQLTRHINQINAESHNNSGLGIHSSSAEFANGSYVYEVGFGINDAGREFGSVVVKNYGRKITEVKCTSFTMLDTYALQ